MLSMTSQLRMLVLVLTSVPARPAQSATCQGSREFGPLLPCSRNICLLVLKYSTGWPHFMAPSLSRAAASMMLNLARLDGALPVQQGSASWTLQRRKDKSTLFTDVKASWGPIHVKLLVLPPADRILSGRKGCCKPCANAAKPSLSLRPPY